MPKNAKSPPAHINQGLGSFSQKVQNPDRGTVLLAETLIFKGLERFWQKVQNPDRETVLLAETQMFKGFENLCQPWPRLWKLVD